MEEPILNSHNKAEYEATHSGDSDTPNIAPTKLYALLFNHGCAETFCTAGGSFPYNLRHFERFVREIAFSRTKFILL